jgi:hypothetical protein
MRLDLQILYLLSFTIAIAFTNFITERITYMDTDTTAEFIANSFSNVLSYISAIFTANVDTIFSTNFFAFFSTNTTSFDLAIIIADFFT